MERKRRFISDKIWIMEMLEGGEISNFFDIVKGVGG